MSYNCNYTNRNIIMQSVRSCWILTIFLGILLKVYAEAAYTDSLNIDGPAIDPNKNEIILQNGQNYTLKCKGKRPLRIKHQDIPEEYTSSFFMKERNLTSTDMHNPFEVALDLFNVDNYAVGYYACFDDTVDVMTILYNIMEEPANTEHVTFTYIYVNGTENVFAPITQFITILAGTKTIIRCRPAMPDIEVTLVLLPQKNKTSYIWYSPKIGFLVKVVDKSYECQARRGSETSNRPMTIIVKKPREKVLDDLEVTVDHLNFLEGDNFTLNCSVRYEPNKPLSLIWKMPRPFSEVNVVNDTNDLQVGSGKRLYYALTVLNAQKDDEGQYSCTLKAGQESSATKSVQKKFLEKPFIKLTTSQNRKIETEVKRFKLKAEVQGYPRPNFTYYRNNEFLPNIPSKFRTNIDEETGDASITILDLTVYDTANYTIVAKNEYAEDSITFDLRKKAIPTVDFTSDTNKIPLLNTVQSIKCEAIGYPLPEIQWIFSTDYNDTIGKGNDTKESEIKISSILSRTATVTGNLICKASNSMGNNATTTSLLVFEIEGGFGIEGAQSWYSEHEQVKILCKASKFFYEDVGWIRDKTTNISDLVSHEVNPYSIIAKLQIDHVSTEHNGTYTCIGHSLNGTKVIQKVDIKVEAARNTEIKDPEVDKDEHVTTFQPVVISCTAVAVPIPTIEWYKDGELLQNNTDGLIIVNSRNFTELNSTIIIERMQDVNKGKYECLATNGYGSPKSRFYNLIMKDSSPFKSYMLGVIVAIIVILIILVIYLTWKIRKEKRFRKELAAAGLLYFKEGVTKSLNPELGIDEQAELLPYDEKFEFPPEKLTLGKQLGAGAFGVVYKAEARGIINAEETTPVAVKMVKKTADNMYIKALASELKIMVHLGKHINIVNLLGACTKNVGKRELIVIVEYCKYGNIHNYIQKHSGVFIDQLTDNKEKNLGRVNRGYSCSSGSSGINSDYFGLNNTQATDHTFINTANTNRSGRKDKQNQQEEFVKVSETGYVQPEWRSNYESDYSYDGRNPRPLCSRDLLAWAFQIARGMEYLASRKVLHGDLAARNVLLAEDNIVKICDFGLARSIYKNDEYQKKENSPLPVKWLAIECMTDRIFSTQSDVWSFGIVLWEMFSLAKTPYPNMSPQHLLRWLQEGNRLEKPPYADDKLYDVMMRCWEHKPNIRPSFTQLQEIIGSFLEDNVRNHYVDLNSAYMELNVKTEGEDYLAMVSAPDYNNLVTPSPHHYMNDVRSFFPPTPTQVPLDEEGYLQMTPANPSIFSPRSLNTKFDFDARKLEHREAEGRGGTELTPMLTLNNLPARSGSDSDHETNSPYLNMSLKNANENDDVFKPTHNNLKNIQNGFAANPMYIANVEIEKKPQDINYTNIPNGLVK